MAPSLVLRARAYHGGMPDPTTKLAMLELHWRWTSHLPRGSIDKAFLCAFDLLKLNGAHLRREPVEVAQGYMASILQKSLHLKPSRP
jgi:hypothetical protein